MDLEFSPQLSNTLIRIPDSGKKGLSDNFASPLHVFDLGQSSKFRMHKMARLPFYRCSDGVKLRHVAGTIFNIVVKKLLEKFLAEEKNFPNFLMNFSDAFQFRMLAFRGRFPTLLINPIFIRLSMSPQTRSILLPMMLSMSIKIQSGEQVSAAGDRCGTGAKTDSS